jgi:hypothetical protein
VPSRGIPQIQGKFWVVSRLSYLAAEHDIYIRCFDRRVAIDPNMFWVLFRKTYFPASSLRITNPLVIGHAARNPRKGFHYPIYAILFQGKTAYSRPVARPRSCISCTTACSIPALQSRRHTGVSGRVHKETLMTLNPAVGGCAEWPNRGIGAVWGQI